MPLFDPIPDEIDLSEKDDAQVEDTTQLPDEIEVGGPDENQAPEGNENTEPEVQEEIQEPAPQEPNDSSLTPEPDAQEPAPETPTEQELSDERVLTYLSEKLGREVKSLDDLTPAEAAEVPEEDEEIKAIKEWKERTGRPVTDFYKFQKDYDSMDAAEAVRENLRLKYPDFTAEEIELEMQDLIADPDLDTDQEIARKNLRLKKESITAKQELNKYKSTFNTPVEPKLTKEQQDAMSFYKQYQEQSQKSSEAVKQYQEGITSETAKIKSIPLSLSDDLSIDLTLSPEDAKALPKQIMETPQWFNEDGSYNTSAIVQDAIKMRHFDKAVKLAYEQGVASGREQEDADSRNVTLGNRQTAPTPKGDEIIVEGADAFDASPKLKFGNRR